MELIYLPAPRRERHATDGGDAAVAVIGVNDVVVMVWLGENKNTPRFRDSAHRRSRRRRRAAAAAALPAAVLPPMTPRSRQAA